MGFYVLFTHSIIQTFQLYQVIFTITFINSTFYQVIKLVDLLIFEEGTILIKCFYGYHFITRLKTILEVVHYC